MGVDEIEQLLHLLGTDRLGRDLLSLYIYGMRSSLLLWTGIAITCSIIAMFVGWLLGKYGGVLNGLVLQALDLLHRIPTIIFRGLFFTSILWWWPQAKIPIYSAFGLLDNVQRTTTGIWIMLLLSGGALILALLLHRHLLIWLLTAWIAHILFNPIAWRIRWGMRSEQPDFNFTLAERLILEMSAPLLITLILIAYITYLQQNSVARSNISQHNLSIYEQPLPFVVAVHALAAMPLLFRPEARLSIMGLGVIRLPQHSLGHLFQNTMNLTTWSSAPWTWTILLVPMLIFVLVELTLNPLFDESFPTPDG